MIFTCIELRTETVMGALTRISTARGAGLYKKMLLLLADWQTVLALKVTIVEHAFDSWHEIAAYLERNSVLRIGEFRKLG